MEMKIESTKYIQKSFGTKSKQPSCLKNMGLIYEKRGRIGSKKWQSR